MPQKVVLLLKRAINDASGSKYSIFFDKTISDLNSRSSNQRLQIKHNGFDEKLTIYGSKDADYVYSNKVKEVYH